MQLCVVVVAALAVTFPFAAQPFAHDEPLMLDFAEMQVETPWQQHLSDFDYFGIHHDRFFQTHPRLQSLYLSLVLRVSGEPSEIPVHAASAVFAVVGGVAVFFLGRRFGAGGLAAALFFLAAPAFFVNSHLAMVDVPGTSLWLAALAAFIYGVDRDRRALLVLAGILFVLAEFTFYQGLSALALALLYLFLQGREKLRPRYLLPPAAAALAFAAYALAFMGAYGEPPLLHYRYGLPGYQRSLANQARGVLVVLGGTVFFPPAAMALFWRNWRAGLALLFSLAATAAWSAVKAATGAYDAGTAILLSLLLPAGVMMAYLLAEGFVVSVAGRLRASRSARDTVFLCAWFFGVVFYCIVMLPYPAPRYLLPAVPAEVIFSLRTVRGALQERRVSLVALLAAVLASTLALSVALGLANLEWARQAPAAADWTREWHGDAGGTTWFDGELGYRYYMEREGYRMLPNILGESRGDGPSNWPENGPRPGDTVVISPLFGAWFTVPEVMVHLRPADIHISRIDGPLTVTDESDISGWSSTTLLPYYLHLDGVPVELQVMKVVAAEGKLPAADVEEYPEEVARLIPEKFIGGEDGR